MGPGRGVTSRDTHHIRSMLMTPPPPPWGTKSRRRQMMEKNGSYFWPLGRKVWGQKVNQCEIKILQWTAQVKFHFLHIRNPRPKRHVSSEWLQSFGAQRFSRLRRQQKLREERGKGEGGREQEDTDPPCKRYNWILKRVVNVLICPACWALLPVHLPPAFSWNPALATEMRMRS